MQEKDSSPPNSEFSIASSSNDFSSRCKDVFSCLQSLEDKHAAHEKSVEDDDTASVDKTGLLKSDPIIEETELPSDRFKKPNLPPAISSGRRDQPETQNLKRPSSELYTPPWQRKEEISTSDYKSRRIDDSTQLKRTFHHATRNKMPDFKLNPEKWKKYSLEDVPDISQTSNTKAAFAFLEERRKLREAAEGMVEVKADVEGGACSRGTIMFKRPPKKGGNQQDSESKHDPASDKLSNIDDFEKDNDNDDELEELVIKPKVTFKSKKIKSHGNIRDRKKESEKDDDDN